MTEKTIDYIKLPDGETYRVGGGSGFNLFDTKISDHILEGNEALGWALQGTYVYKEGVAGSRTGYADFYERCLDELSKSEPIAIAKFTPLEITSYTASSGWSNVANAFDGASDTYATCGTATDYIECVFGNETILTGVVAHGKHVGDKARACNIAVYSVDSTGTETLLATGTGATKSSTYTTNAVINNTTVSKVRIKLIDGDNGAEPTTKYPTRLSEITFIGEGIATPVYYYKNSNGHLFYNINDKSTFDEIYTNTGIADFYGVDTENERIFLPRNDKFVQLTGDTSKVNNTVEAGLPNITGTVKGGGNGSDWMSGAFTYLNSDTAGVSGYHDGGADKNYASGTAQFNASNSNSIYGKSSTVQPPSSLKLLYYCVGNTKVESAVSNVTEITTSENDTLPLFYNFYSQEDMTTTGAYVNASLGSWLSGNVYTTAYNELVNKLGTDNVKANTDTYTDYDFVLNQDDMTFRLPLSNGDNYGVGNLYYKVGNSVTNLEILDAGKVMNALNTVVPDNASLISSYGMCSGVMISLTPGASGTWYTAPTNGIVRAWGYKNTSQNNYINIYTDKGGATGVYVPQNWGSPNLSIRVAKGEKFQVTDYNDISAARLSFYYLKGEV